MRLHAPLVLALCGLALAGCGPEPTPPPAAPPTGLPGSPGSSTAASPNGPSTPETAPLLTQADLDAVGRSDKTLHLALVVKTRNNPFFDPMIKAAEAEAAALGATIEVQAPAQETDKERQFAMIQDLVARKVDAILIAPADSKALYFVARGDGSSQFSETLDEHNRAVNKFQRGQ